MDPAAVLVQAIQHLLPGMSVGVILSHADNRQLWESGSQQFVGGGLVGSMVTHHQKLQPGQVDLFEDMEDL